MLRLRLGGLYLLIQRYKHRYTGFIADFTGNVSLAREVFGDENVAWTKAPHGAIADFDVNGTG